jgi:hypothetical protein
MKIKTEIEVLQGRIRAATGRSVFVKYCVSDDEALFKAQECSIVDQHGIITDCDSMCNAGECDAMLEQPECCPRCREFWVFSYGEARALEVCGEAKSEA